MPRREYGLGGMKVLPILPFISGIFSGAGSESLSSGRVRAVWRLQRQSAFRPFSAALPRRTVRYRLHGERLSPDRGWKKSDGYRGYL